MSKSSHCYLLQLNLSRYREESIIHNKVKTQCSLFTYSFVTHTCSLFCFSRLYLRPMFLLVVFVFVSSLPFFISFFVCSFLYVFSISVSLFQILNALIQNFASCFCLQLDYITIYFPLAGCICLIICFISFCPRTI